MKSLPQHILNLEKAGELLHVNVRVDPLLEIAEITDRISKSPSGGKALLFTDTGTDFPVITNMMGSDRRMATALGVNDLGEITKRIESLVGKALSPKNGLSDKLKILPLLGEVSRWLPRISHSRGECQQVILKGNQADLAMLPILKCWPHDGGRFITLPLVNTIDPETGVRNVGMYRMQVMGPRETGMHWHIHKTGERHYRAYERLGQKMPLSVCIGGDPIYTYAATAPMPDGMDEYLLAGFLRRRSVKLVKCVTNDIYVPSDCDFVIEGYIDPSEGKVREGPFGDHTGFYSLEDKYPLFHVTAITHRRDAVYPATIVGIPPQEDLYISKATEKIFLAPIRLVMQPEICDLYMPAAGVAHNLALASIKSSYPGQAFKVASSMWGAGQMMFNKVMIVAAAGTDIRNPKVVARLLRNADMEKDAMFSRGVLDVLDHSPEVTGEGGKLALDLTVDRPDREIRIAATPELPGWVVGVDVTLAEEYGAVILRCESDSDIDLSQLAAKEYWKGVNYVVATDVATAELSTEELLWFILGNTEPGRDINVVNGVMLIDSRTKYPYREGYPVRVPNLVTSSAETISLVDSRWDQYDLGDFISSPSEKYLPMVVGDKAQIE